MSKFVSRKRSVRDSGNAAAETFATSLDCDSILKSGPRPTTATSSPGSSVLLRNVALLTGVSPISFGSYETTARLCSGWMYSTRPGISSEPANVKPHVAHRDGHGVAVDDDPAALGVGDEPRAVVIAVRDARHRIRHVEVHEHERRRDGLHVALALARERRALAGLDGLARRARRERLARPHAERVVAAAALRREPAAVVRDQPLPLGRRLVERHESHGHLRVVGQRLEHALEVVEVVRATRCRCRSRCCRAGSRPCRTRSRDSRRRRRRRSR